MVGGAVPVVQFYVGLMISLQKRGWHLLARLVSNRLQRGYGVYISSRAEIDPSIRFRHPVGIVVGEGVKIGKGVIIYQNVTLGGARTGDAAANNYPTVGDGTVIFAGAVIVGKINIGRGCVIGANAVVTRDIPDHSTAVGVPARVVAQQVPHPQVSRDPA